VTGASVDGCSALRHHAVVGSNARRALLAVAVLVASGCAQTIQDSIDLEMRLRGAPHAPADAAALRLLARGGTLVATALGRSFALHVEPGTDRPFMHLDADNPWGQPLRLLVLGGARDPGAGDVWVRVQIPIWPNGQTGWVAASDVRLAETLERVVVDLSDRTLLRFGREGAVAKVPVGIGAAGTPTPPGRYVVWARVATGRPAGPYGSFILGLSGFSESIVPYREWPGLPRLAIHGTDDPGDAGHAVSNGCVRVLNPLLRRLRTVPIGTPVVIRP